MNKDAGKDATRRLAQHASTLQYETLPPALVELAKQCVLDTLGVCIGASTLASEAPIVADYVREASGGDKPESSVLGFRRIWAGRGRNWETST
jgi:2-methylcitrate dehydratase PrpD